jgi:hypothetical protein
MIKKDKTNHDQQKESSNPCLLLETEDRKYCGSLAGDEQPEEIGASPIALVGARPRVLLHTVEGRRRPAANWFALTTALLVAADHHDGHQRTARTSHPASFHVQGEDGENIEIKI